jgi:hypothetical protein
MLNPDALYYPYIHFRDPVWLRRSLLVFPKIYRMIPDRYNPNDDKKILEFSAFLDYAKLDTKGVRIALERLLGRIKDDIARDARFTRRFSKNAAARWKRKTNDPFGYQLHSRKAATLLRELKELKLAWDPARPDGHHYIEMHPNIGEAIMSTLAVACALDAGLNIVAESARLHDSVQRNAESEIYDQLIHGHRPQNRALLRADRSKVELLILQRFDLSKLTPKNLQKLRDENALLDSFRLQMMEVAESIGEMRDQDQFEKRLRQKVGDTISMWQKSKLRPRAYAREFFKGIHKPGGDFFKSMAEKIAGPLPVAAGAATTYSIGGLTSGTLLGAVVGLGVALVLHANSSIQAVKDREKKSPYRFLTMLEKSGVAYTAGGKRDIRLDAHR